MESVSRINEQVKICCVSMLNKAGPIKWYLSLEEDKKYPRFFPQGQPINVSVPIIIIYI